MLKMALRRWSREGENMPFFYSVQDLTKPFNRVNLNKQVNKVYSLASQELQKNIRSHSFRCTFITNLLRSNVPLHTVKDIVRHSSMTAKYNRSILTKKELERTINAV